MWVGAQTSSNRVMRISPAWLAPAQKATCARLVTDSSCSAFELGSARAYGPPVEGETATSGIKTRGKKPTDLPNATLWFCFSLQAKGNGGSRGLVAAL